MATRGGGQRLPPPVFGDDAVAPPAAPASPQRIAATRANLLAKAGKAKAGQQQQQQHRSRTTASSSSTTTGAEGKPRRHRRRSSVHLRDGDDEPVTADTDLGRAGSITKEQLKLEAAARVAEASAEAERARFRIDSVLDEFQSVVMPGSTKPKQVVIPGQGHRGMNTLSASASAPAIGGHHGQPENPSIATPADSREAIDAMRGEVSALLQKATARKAEQKDALDGVRKRLAVIREQERSEAKARRRRRRQAALADRLRAIADGTDDADGLEHQHCGTPEPVKDHHKRGKRYKNKAGPEPELSAADMAQKLMGENQSQMTAKVFLTANAESAAARAAEDDLGDEDYEDDSAWDTDDMDDAEHEVLGALEKADEARDRLTAIMKTFVDTATHMNEDKFKELEGQLTDTISVVSELREALESKDKQITNMTNRLAAFEGHDSLEEAARALANELSVTRVKLEHTQDSLETAKGEQRSMAMEAQRVTAQLAEVKQELVHVREDNSELVRTNTRLETEFTTEHNNLQRANDRVADLERLLKTSRSELSRANDLNVGLTARTNGYELDIRKLRAEVEALQVSAEAAWRDAKEYAAAMKKMEEQELRLSMDAERALQGENDSLKSKLQRMKSRLQDLERDLKASQGREREARAAAAAAAARTITPVSRSEDLASAPPPPALGSGRAMSSGGPPITGPAPPDVPQTVWTELKMMKAALQTSMMEREQAGMHAEDLLSQARATPPAGRPFSRQIDGSVSRPSTHPDSRGRPADGQHPEAECASCRCPLPPSQPHLTHRSSSGEEVMLCLLCGEGVPGTQLALPTPMSCNADTQVVPRDIDKEMLGLDRPEVTEATKLKERLGAIKADLSDMRTQNHSLSTENHRLASLVSSLTEANDRMHADRHSLAIMQAVLKSLGDRPETVRAVAAMRAGMQRQVSEIRREAASVTSSTGAKLQQQQALVGQLKRYIMTMGASLGVDVSSMPGFDAKAAAAMKDAGAKPRLAHLFRRVMRTDGMATGGASGFMAAVRNAITKERSNVAWDRAAGADGDDEEGGGQQHETKDGQVQQQQQQEGNDQQEGQNQGVHANPGQMVATGAEDSTASTAVAAPVSATTPMGRMLTRVAQSFLVPKGNEQDGEAKTAGGGVVEAVPVLSPSGSHVSGQPTAQPTGAGVRPPLAPPAGPVSHGALVGTTYDAMEPGMPMVQYEAGRGSALSRLAVRGSRQRVAPSSVPAGGGNGVPDPVADSLGVDPAVVEGLVADAEAAAEYWEEQCEEARAELDEFRADAVMLHNLGQCKAFFRAVSALLTELEAVRAKYTDGGHVPFGEVMSCLEQIRNRAAYPLRVLRTRIDGQLVSLLGYAYGKRPRARMEGALAGQAVIMEPRAGGVSSQAGVGHSGSVGGHSGHVSGTASAMSAPGHLDVQLPRFLPSREGSTMSDGLKSFPEAQDDDQEEDEEQVVKVVDVDDLARASAQSSMAALPSVEMPTPAVSTTVKVTSPLTPPHNAAAAVGIRPSPVDTKPLPPPNRFQPAPVEMDDDMDYLMDVPTRKSTAVVPPMVSPVNQAPVVVVSPKSLPQAALKSPASQPLSPQIASSVSTGTDTTPVTVKSQQSSMSSALSDRSHARQRRSARSTEEEDGNMSVPMGLLLDAHVIPGKASGGGGGGASSRRRRSRGNRGGGAGGVTDRSTASHRSAGTVDSATSAMSGRRGPSPRPRASASSKPLAPARQQPQQQPQQRRKQPTQRTMSFGAASGKGQQATSSASMAKPQQAPKQTPSSSKKPSTKAQTKAQTKTQTKPKPKTDEPPAVAVSVSTVPTSTPTSAVPSPSDKENPPPSGSPVRRRPYIPPHSPLSPVRRDPGAYSSQLEMTPERDLDTERASLPSRGSLGSRGSANNSSSRHIAHRVPSSRSILSRGSSRARLPKV